VKRILVDAYNFLFTYGSKASSLEKKREELIYSMDEFAEKLNCSIILVFDGERKKGRFQRSHVKHLEIVYTPPEISADEYILEALRGSPKDEILTVVTSDRLLAKESKRLGAIVMTIKGFIKWATAKMEKRPHESEKLLKETDRQMVRYLKIFEKSNKNS
jgi:predicted RNA-binding protein with PIN domain